VVLHCCSKPLCAKSVKTIKKLQVSKRALVHARALLGPAGPGGGLKPSAVKRTLTQVVGSLTMGASGRHIIHDPMQQKLIDWLLMLAACMQGARTEGEEVVWPTEFSAVRRSHSGSSDA
jgi:hypothetical protein